MGTGPTGEGREGGTPDGDARLGRAREGLGPAHLAGNPSVVVSFPDPHSGPKGAGTLTQRAPEPFAEFHPLPIHMPGAGWMSAQDQAPRLLYLLWDLGREERGGSDPQDGEGAQACGSQGVLRALGCWWWGGAWALRAKSPSVNNTSALNLEKWHR